MPKLMDTTMEQLNTASNYKFSAVKVDELGASEYTLVTIAQDTSGSVSAFRADMENCLKTIMASCKKSPKAENLMMRLISFSDNLQELHGFKLLDTVNDTDYDNILNIGGYTALFDAVQSSVEATAQYAEILREQDFLSNAIIFIVTDGDDNASRATANSVKKAIAAAVKSEVLESLTVVLVGVNTGDNMIADRLQDFQKQADITQYVDIGTATAGKLAKLANFVSQSISSTSQALGSGSASQLLTF